MYVLCTADEYELPVAVGTPDEIAEQTKINRHRLYKSVNRKHGIFYGKQRCWVLKLEDG